MLERSWSAGWSLPGGRPHDLHVFMTGPARHQVHPPLYADPVQAELVGTGLFYGVLSLPLSLILGAVGLFLELAQASQRQGQTEAEKEFLARFRDLENSILNADVEQPEIEK
jgi:hypothetical protein